MNRDKTRILVECGLMIAMGTVLSYVPIFQMPMGGDVTLCSMMPLVVVSFRHGPRWGLFTGFVHGVLQMILGVQNLTYCPTIAAMAGCIVLDYLLAFTVMGTSCLWGKKIRNRNLAVAVGATGAGMLRFACSFLSGILIWGGNTPEGTPVWLYSLIYNGSYMLPEIIITAVSATGVIALLSGKNYLSTN